MKRCLSALLAVLFLLTMLPIGAVSAVTAATTPTIVVSDATGNAGDTVTVTVSLKNNPGLVSAKVKVGYDTAALELLDYAAGDFSTSGYSWGKKTGNPFVINFCDAIADADYTDELFATLTFKIKDDAVAGVYPLTLTYDCDDDFYARNWDTIYFTHQNGSVTVNSTAPQPTPTIVVSDATGNAGDTITVTVSLKDNPGLISAKVKVGYDASALELLDYAAGDFPSSSYSWGKKTKNPFVINFCDGIADADYTDELFATLTFKIKDDAVAGVYPLTLTYDCDDDFYARNWDTIYFTHQNGSVTVNSTAPQPTPTIVVSDATGNAGDTITVTVSLKDNPGLVSAKVKVGYDASALELLDYAAGDFPSSGYSWGKKTNNPFVINFCDAIADADYTEELLATLTFKIKGDAVAGTYPLTLEYDWKGEFYNCIANGMEAVYFTHEEGSVTVLPPASSFDGYIVNGDFETGDLQPWDNLWDSCPKAEVVKGGMDSNWALEIVSGQWKHVRQTNIAVEANTDYKISVWVKNAKGMSLLVKDGGDSVDIVNQAIEAGDEWTLLSIEFHSGRYTSIIFSLMGNNADEAYGTFDNVVMAKVDYACAHVYDHACDTICNVCGLIRQVPDHIYDHACDTDCNICGVTRQVPDHVYDNACDATCNECGNLRSVPDHVYDNACDATCNECGNLRNVPDHVYDNACDATCDVCGALRNVPDHVYDHACDADCNVCGASRFTLSEPTFTDPTITVSNAGGNPGDTVTVIVSLKNNPGLISAVVRVGYNTDLLELVSYAIGDLPSYGYSWGDTRKSPFVINFCDALSYDNYTNETLATLTFKIKADAPNGIYPFTLEYDCEGDFYTTTWDAVYFDDWAGSVAVGNVFVPDHVYDNACDTDCNVCGIARQVPDHVYDNACDTDCNFCGVVRQVPDHVYDNPCDTDCNVCGVTRQVPDHVYDNACDVDCNECGNLRNVPNHVYDNACDVDCNECGTIRQVPDHVYDNSCDADCNACGAVRDDIHRYTNACDRDCNLCGAVRVAPHVYASDCDEHCNLCDAWRDAADHVYDHHCDTTCNLCGEVRPANDHLYSDNCDSDCNACGAVRVPPHNYDNACDSRCDSCGTVRKVPDHVYTAVCDPDCNECGAVRTAAPHAYVGQVILSATCVKEGLRSYTCALCGDNYSEVIPATGHTPVTVFGYAPTCTVDGLTDGERCSVCRTVLVAQQSIDATGHSLIVLPGYAATCTTNGLTDGEKCQACLEIFKSQKPIPAFGHSAVATIGYAPTCTEDGLTDGEKCTTCDGILTAQKVIPALGHTDVPILGHAATCTTDGLTDGAFCLVCNALLVEQYTIPAFGHTPVITVGYAATCTEDGLTNGEICANCSTVFVAQQVIPAFDHSPMVIHGFNATCTTTGLTNGEVCTVCDATLIPQSVIPATGHTVTTLYGHKATCTADGLTDGEKCAVCGIVLVAQEIIPATGHTVTTVAGYAPTCGTPGMSDSSFCSACFTILLEGVEIPATGNHDYVSEITTEATCATDGVCTYTCAVCGDSYTTSVPATGQHDYVEKITVQPTCTVEGVCTYTCAVCGDSYTASVPINDNHAFSHIYDPDCNACGIVREVPEMPETGNGDADGNGLVNNRDMGYLQQYLNDWQDVPLIPQLCDVDGNGYINNRDLGYIQQYLNDWNITLG